MIHQVEVERGGASAGPWQEAGPMRSVFGGGATEKEADRDSVGAMVTVG